MKRLFGVVLLLFLVFSGCGNKIDNPESIETAPPFSCITVTVSEESQDFGSFTAGPAGDVESAVKLVQAALERYPAGFADQWGPVEIILVGGLTGTEDFAGGRYAGFTQSLGGGWRMVLDADRVTAGTIHHEIAHILDGILTEAGVLTEAEWMAFCPSGFAYGPEQPLCPDFFTDAYAMTDIREDRARTFEEAMLWGPGVYADSPALWLKLEYFSRAIRTHFDTTLWPEKTVWELGQCMHPRYALHGPITKSSHGCRDGIRRANEDPS